MGSQSQEALDTAITQTRGWWHPQTQRHGLRKRQILTVGNVLVTLILPYVVTITEKNDKNKSESQGFCLRMMALMKDIKHFWRF